MKRWLFTMLAAFLLLLLCGCSLVIPAARIELAQPLGTTYWGPANNGLSAGIAMRGPVLDEKKIGSGPHMPAVVALCKLRNVGDGPIRVVRPFHESMARAASVSDPVDRFRPDSFWWPDALDVTVELAPGEEIAHEYEYRLPARPHDIAVRFEYGNPPGDAGVRVEQAGQIGTSGDLWTGRVESGVLRARIR